MSNNHDAQQYLVSQRSLEILACFNTFSSETLVGDADYLLTLFGNTFIPGPFSRSDFYFGVGYANDDPKYPNRTIFRFLLSEQGDINLYYDDTARFERPRTPISVSTLLTNRYRVVFTLSELEMAIYEGKKFLQVYENNLMKKLALENC